MKTSYSVAEAAELLGMAKQTLRLWLRSGRCPFGAAWIGSGSEYIYYISGPRLREYLKSKV